MAGPIRIAVLANASQARRELNGVASTTTSLGSKLGKFGKTAGVAVAAGLAVAGAAALKFGVASVKAASDAQQSLGATETVFGRYAKTVIKRSNEAATAVGISANEYRELSNVVGASLTGAGLSIQRATVLTGDLNKRAADMAATFGGTTRQAVEAVSSALRGETDPIERYGVSIKQADVNARLAAQGQDSLTGAARKAAEMQARLDLIFAKTAKTQGAFSRESNTLAHQQQVLGAQFENIKAKIGTALLPVLTKAFAYVNTTVIPAAQRLGATLGRYLAPIFDRIKTAAGDLAERLQPVADWFRSNPELVKGAGIALGIAAAAATALAIAMGAVALATSPITLTVLAIAALGAGLAYAYKHSETFRNAVQGIGTAFQNLITTITPIVQQIVATVVGKFTELQPQLSAIWSSIQSIIQSAMSIIRSVIQAVTAAIKTIWQNFGGTMLRFITTTMTNIANLIKNVFKIIQGIFKTVSSALKGDWSGMWSGIKTIASGAIGAVKAILAQGWNLIRTAAASAWTAIKGAVAKAWDGIKSAVSTGISATVKLVKSLPGKMLAAIGDLSKLLINAGRSLISGLISGITEKVGDLKDKLGSVTKLIPDWKGPAERDANLLRPAGRLIMGGLVAGITDGTAPLAKKLDEITTKIRAKLEEQRGQLKSVLDGIKSDFASLADSISSAFTGNLFDATDTVVDLGGLSIITQTADQAFTNNLLGVRGKLKSLRVAFKQLLRWGLDPKFLSQLFASGNAGLIIDLATGTRKDARYAANLFGQVTDLSSKLGKQVARSDLGPKIDRTNTKLDTIVAELRTLNGKNRTTKSPDNPGRRARDITSQDAPDSRRRAGSTTPSSDDLLGQLNKLAKEQNTLLNKLIQVEQDSPREFGKAINRAVVNGKLGR